MGTAWARHAMYESAFEVPKRNVNIYHKNVCKNMLNRTCSLGEGCWAKRKKEEEPSFRNQGSLPSCRRIIQGEVGCHF
jgi:hypothetical protein